MTTHRMTRFPNPLIPVLPVCAVSPYVRADTDRPGSEQRTASPGNGPILTTPDLIPVQNAPSMHRSRPGRPSSLGMTPIALTHDHTPSREAV